MEAAREGQDLAVVRAAGGVVRSGGDLPSVLLVHRPRYDDWTLPKGKAEPGESDEACALREVEEETGLRCRLEGDLGTIAYEDARGRPKHVRFFAMQPEDGAFTPTKEVDAVRMLAVDDAWPALTHERERDVLLRFLASRGIASILLVRHASAGDRKRWSGDDRLRPLDERGRRQAGRLAEALPFAVEGVLSSPYVRCTETVEPFAAVRHLTVEPTDELGEGASRSEIEGLLTRVAGRTTVLCTHGDVVEELLGSSIKKGATAILAARGGAATLLEVRPPPA